MFTDTAGLPPETIQAVLRRYDLRPDAPPVPAGGTAAPKVIFPTDGKPYLLRRRREEFCPEPVVRFDHSLIHRLAEAALPAMIAETWFCCRIRAMRKVPDEKKLEILADDLEPTLDFLDTADWPWRET